MADLSSLPTELLVHILAHLDLRSLVRASVLSQRFFALVNRSPDLQYRALLLLSGLVHNHASPLPLHSRLDLLIHHVRAYTPLTPRLTTRIPLTLPANDYEPGSTYELVDGIFARGARFRHAQDHTTRALTFVVLPSIALDILDHRTWPVILPVPISDFAIDPAQDLLAVVEAPDFPLGQPAFAVHFLTMRDAGPHPDARVRRVTFAVPNPVDFDHHHGYNYILHICGDRVGVLFRPSGNKSGHHLVTWDWRTGEQISVYSPPRQNTVSSFSFLSPTHALLCTAAEIPSSTFNLDVVSLTSPSAHLTLRFIPPDLEGNLHLIPPVLRSGACPAPPSQRPLSVKPILPPLPFLNDPSPDARIFSLSFEAMFEVWHHLRTSNLQPQRVIGHRRYILYAPGSLFLTPPPSVLSSLEFDPELPRPACNVPWDAWGRHVRWKDASAFPLNTHVCHTHNWSHVYFSRIAPHRPPSPHSIHPEVLLASRIRLLEFPPPSLPLPPRANIVSQPHEVIHARPVFSYDVDTDLRAEEREREAGVLGMEGCTGICVDGWERFVGMENGEDEEDEEGREVEGLRIAVF